ncbi:MAG: TetR family transcriptional regulator [Acidimicrobiales bacterium]
MVRWEPDARARLEEAAFDLYEEGGFDRTTVAEIAERAGLAERTFFRYFTDKKEVLFSGAETLTEQVVSAVTNAPAVASPVQAAKAGLEAAAALLQDRRPFAIRRQRIIAASPELEERELIKLSMLARSVAAALSGRGVTDSAASLTAEASMAVFREAFQSWIRGEDVPFTEVMESSWDQLSALLR